MLSKKELEQFEQDQNLFDICIQKVPIWERVRNGIAKDISVRQGGGQEKPNVEKSISDYMKGGMQLMANIVRKNPFLSSSARLLVVGLSRRKLDNDNLWVDIYSDPVVESCNLEYTYFEKSHNLEHKSPTRTERMRYLDLIEYLPKLDRILPKSSISISDEDKKAINNIEYKIQERFDANIDVYSRIKNTLQHRKIKIPLYERLLQTVDPDLVLIVKHTNKRCLIESCKNSNIPVAELQHGAIHENHFAYSFPSGRKIETFPDYLLTFGEFWNTNANYPIEESRILPVGYPYLQQYVDKYYNNNSKDQIIFISQGTIGTNLSKFALKVSQHPNINYNIVYKLHPGEYDRWQEDYPWLIEANIEVVDSSEPPLYELFAESSVQVGVYSTAVFEGLAFDLETFVYDCSRSNILEPLIQEESAIRISSADELASSLGNKSQAFNTEYYFASNATKRMCETLNHLANVGKSDSF